MLAVGRRDHLTIVRDLNRRELFVTINNAGSTNVLQVTELDICTSPGSQASSAPSIYVYVFLQFGSDAAMNAITDGFLPLFF